MKKITALKVERNILGFIEFMLTFGPMIIFIILGFANKEITTQSKVVLSMTVMMSLILTLIAVVGKFNLRSPMFIVLFGLYKCLSNISTVIVIFGICTIADELIIGPMYKHYKEEYRMHKAAIEEIEISKGE